MMGRLVTAAAIAVLVPGTGVCCVSDRPDRLWRHLSRSEDGQRQLRCLWQRLPAGHPLLQRCV